MFQAIYDKETGLQAILQDADVPQWLEEHAADGPYEVLPSVPLTTLPNAPSLDGVIHFLHIAISDMLCMEDKVLHLLESSLVGDAVRALEDWFGVEGHRSETAAAQLFLYQSGSTLLRKVFSALCEEPPRIERALAGLRMSKEGDGKDKETDGQAA